jgi:hypothetical protein
MDNREIIAHITTLVEEEHDLVRRAGEHGGLDAAERERMQALEVALDQCWDLLRQRRARRDAGLNPDDAQVRPPETVERYRQ